MSVQQYLETLDDKDKPHMQWVKKTLSDSTMSLKAFRKKLQDNFKELEDRKKLNSKDESVEFKAVCALGLIKRFS